MKETKKTNKDPPLGLGPAGHQANYASPPKCPAPSSCSPVAVCAPWPSVRDAAGGCSPSRRYRGARRSIRPPRPRGRTLVPHHHFLLLLSSPAHVDEPPSPRSLPIPRPPTSPRRDTESAHSFDRCCPGEPEALHRPLPRRRPLGPDEPHRTIRRHPCDPGFPKPVTANTGRFAKFPHSPH